VEWVQIDEPALATDLPELWWTALDRAYTQLSGSGVKLLLTTYFGGVDDHAGQLKALPVAGLHIDLCRAPDQLDAFVPDYPRDKVLSLGVIDGRNIWRADLSRILDRLEPVIAKLGKHLVQVAPSCSLLHVPIDLALEAGLDPEIKSWLAFSVQKLEELTTLGTALAGGRGSVESALRISDEAAAARKTSPRIHDAKVSARVAGIDEAMRFRASIFAERATVQRERFNLPAFPTTTIGSFPQTADVRKARAAHAKGALTDEAYKLYLQNQTARTVRWQENIGLDVLVHGEFERNDMVQYFGEQLAGFAFTANGWVQSYGSRYVRPPVLFGDVSRPRAMTVEWWQYAQSLTKKPMKAMLTGPVTILNWSFVRDDIARSEACRQYRRARTTSSGS
jgi:5-methyltetrahydropteroyltriglutamate--homocysteine methyltransferase